MWKIDLHTHILPPHWPDLRRRYGYGGFVQLEHNGTGCALACHSTTDGTDSYSYALNNGIQLRYQVVNQGIQEPCDIRGTMLAVSIERHHVTGVLLQRKLYPGLQRSTLPQIGRVRNYSRPGGDRNVPGAVLRAIIDDNHPIASPYKVRDDRTDHRGLVKRRNNDPYRARIEFFTML